MPAPTKTVDWKPLSGAKNRDGGFYFPESVRAKCKGDMPWTGLGCRLTSGAQAPRYCACQGRGWVANEDAETWGLSCATVNIKILIESLFEDEESDEQHADDTHGGEPRHAQVPKHDDDGIQALNPLLTVFFQPYP